jgi:hypothetical protein
MRKFVVCSLVAAICASVAGTASADNRANVSKKGSALIYSAVELKWLNTPDGFRLYQDTFLEITNDYPADVDVQLYFCNGDEDTDAIFAGDPPTLVERAHPGWNCVDCQITLTGDQSTYIRISDGGECQPFTVLDPGFPPGRPAAIGGGSLRWLRGFVYAWAVDADGEEIRWNHLSGSVTTVNYFRPSAWEYAAMAYQACPGDSCAHGAAPDGTPGQIQLDGVEYDISPAKLLFDFECADIGGNAFDTDLTLHPVSADLRQDTNGPVTTKAKFDIWNENEVRFSGTEKCITCWDQTLLADYDSPNHMLCENLQTRRGKARIDGMGSTQCPFSVDAAILGVAVKEFENPRGPEAGRTLVGQGEEAATILWDIIDRPEEGRN